MTPTFQPSRAAIAGHPLHPSIVPLPIAFLSSALATDLAYAGTGDQFWARASRWLLRAGVVSALAAAPLGLLDFLSIPRARRAEGWLHAGGNGVVLALSLVNLAARERDERGSVIPVGLALSGAAASLLAVTGWAGGELTYRYGIGVSSRAASTEDASGRASAPRVGGGAGGRTDVPRPHRAGPPAALAGETLATSESLMGTRPTVDPTGDRYAEDLAGGETPVGPESLGSGGGPALDRDAALPASRGSLPGAEAVDEHPEAVQDASEAARAP